MSHLAVGVSHPLLLSWCAARFNATPETYGWTLDNTRSVALLADDFTPQVVVVLSNYKRDHIEATVASAMPGKATLRLINACYSYVFETLGVRRINMFTAVSNTAAVNSHKALGHQQEGLVREWFGAEQDAVLFGFTRNDWLTSKWYSRRKQSNGFTVSTADAGLHGRRERDRRREPSGSEVRDRSEPSQPVHAVGLSHLEPKPADHDV